MAKSNQVSSKLNNLNCTKFLSHRITEMSSSQ